MKQVGLAVALVATLGTEGTAQTYEARLVLEREAVAALTQRTRSLGRIQCAQGEYEPLNLRGGIAPYEYQEAAVCRAIQDVTVREGLEDSTYNINSLVTDVLAIESSPGFFSSEDGDGKPRPQDTNPATGRSYSMSYSDEVSINAFQGNSTYTAPSGEELPLICELASEMGFSFGAAYAGYGNGQPHPFIQNATVLTEAEITDITNQCYDDDIGAPIQFRGQYYSDLQLGFVAGVARGMSAYRTATEN